MRAILMFHGVDDSGSVLSVTPHQLRSLLRHVVASGHRIVPLRSVLQAAPHAKQVAITFDDGFESVARRAAPVLAELGCPATLFVTTGYVGRDNRWPSQPSESPRYPMMQWSDVSDLVQQGWDIQAHSVTHPDLRALSDAEIALELDQSNEELAQRVGKRPDLFAYPYGYLDERVAALVRERYRHAVTTTFDTLGAPRDAHRQPRLDAYYLREPSVHRFFGGRRFAAYLALRAAGRRLKRHPGETG